MAFDIATLETLVRAGRSALARFYEDLGNQLEAGQVSSEDLPRQPPPPGPPTPTPPAAELIQWLGPPNTQCVGLQAQSNT